MRHEGKGVSSGYDSIISPVLMSSVTQTRDIPRSNILLTAWRRYFVEPIGYPSMISISLRRLSILPSGSIEYRDPPDIILLNDGPVRPVGGGYPIGHKYGTDIRFT